jgi:hypothetical protein
MKGFRKPLSHLSLVVSRLLHEPGLLERESSEFTSEEV